MIFYFTLGISFFISGMVLIQRIKSVSDDFYKQKKDAIIISTFLQSGTLVVLGARYTVTMLYFTELSGFILHS
jgi:hypothetical protein